MQTATRDRPGRPRLGEILIAAGVLDDTHLQAALAEQRKWGDRLGRTLVHMGFLSEEHLALALSRQLQLPVCRPDRDPMPPDVTDHLGVLACERYGVFPLGAAAGVLRLATADPTNAPLLDELASITNLRVDPVIATERSIGRAIRRYYYGEPIDPPATAEPPPLAAESVVDLIPAPDETPGAVPVELTPLPDDLVPARGPSAAPAGRAEQRSPPDGSTEVDVPVGDLDLEVALLRETVTRLEEDLTREVRALRGLVETLLDRGLITREELLAHVRGKRD